MRRINPHSIRFFNYPHSFNYFGAKFYSQINNQFFVKQKIGDYNCMVASTATILNEWKRAKLYGLQEMKAYFDETLAVGDSNTSGYDNVNLRKVMLKLGANFIYLGYESDWGAPEKMAKLRGLLTSGMVMVSMNGDVKHSCVLCDIDKFDQFHVYDPAYGCILTHQKSEFLRNVYSVDYYIKTKTDV